MSYVRIWVHCVWGTKRAVQFFTNANKNKIIYHIKENAKKQDIYVDFINAHKEHIHCLISLNPDQAISKVMQLIKGESSFWINRNNIIKTRFEWTDEYFAVSVSESDVNQVREYIKNQEEHHKKKTWQEEYTEFMEKYGFVKMKG